MSVKQIQEESLQRLKGSASTQMVAEDHAHPEAHSMRYIRSSLGCAQALLRLTKVFVTVFFGTWAAGGILQTVLQGSNICVLGDAQHGAAGSGGVGPCRSLRILPILPILRFLSILPILLILGFLGVLQILPFAKILPILRILSILQILPILQLLRILPFLPILTILCLPRILPFLLILIIGGRYCIIPSGAKSRNGVISEAYTCVASKCSARGAGEHSSRGLRAHS